MPSLRLRLGTRGSPLALAQAEEARRRICRANGFDDTSLELYPIATTGDRRTDRPLAELGGKGLFAREIDDALLRGEIDLAIHSAKDLAGAMPDGLAIAAALPRGSPQDCLICHSAHEIRRLPPGARVGTSSPRRRAQLLHIRRDLSVGPLRGNIGTRLAATGPDGAFAATILAAAGLRRLGIGEEHASPIDVSDMLPAVGQGIIAIVARTDDPANWAVAARTSHPPTACALKAERGLLCALGGDCHSPIAGLAVVRNGTVELEAEILSQDGARRIRQRRCGAGSDALQIGRSLAAELLDDAGPDLWKPLA